MATTTNTMRTTGKPNPKPASGRCGLTLRINGVPYRVRPFQPEASGVLKAFTLTRPGGEPYAVAETTEGPSCDCADFEFRRINTGTDCKHLAAARACGLL